MVTLADGAIFEMQWKQVKYVKHNSYIIFQIIPMLSDKDIIIIPNREKWRDIQNIFSFEEREEIIFLLERINWKRDIVIIEMNIEPCINKKINIQKGMIESTEGYVALSKEKLFDINSKLNKKQVKEVYCKLEEKYAKNAKGIVLVSKETLIEGSIEKEISIPTLKSNKAVTLEIV